MRFVTAGGLRADYLITHDGQAHVGLVGGNAVYAAVGAALWSDVADHVGIWARRGTNYPHAWLDELTAHGLDASGIIEVAGEQDHRTFFAYTPQGARVDTEPTRHFARVGLPLPPALEGYIHSTPGQDNPNVYEPLALRASDWPAAWNSAAAVHFSPLALATHLNVPAMLRAQGVAQITVDPGERYMIPQRASFIRRLLPHIDAFLPSDMEIRSLFGPDVAPAEAARRLCDWGAPLVVVKLGPNGVLLQPGPDGEPLRVPAFYAPDDPHVVDVTGAGDAFCGGFMVGLARTGDPMAAAQMGTVAASLVLEGYGALYALRHALPGAVEQRLVALRSR